MSVVGQNPTFAYVDVTEQGSPPGPPPAGHERLYSGTDGKVYKKNSAGVETEIGSGGLTPVSENASFVAESGNSYLVDTSGGAVVVTLPAGADGDVMRFTDATGSWATNATTLTPATGEKFQGEDVDETLVCDIANGWVELTWDTANSQWVVLSSGIAIYAEAQPGSNAGYVGANGLRGRTNGVTVPSGVLGQTITAVAGSSVSYAASSISKNVTSLTLTPGVWIVSGTVAHTISAISGFGYLAIGISTTNGVLDATCCSQETSSVGTTADFYLSTPLKFLNVSVDTPVYLVGNINYSTITGTYGGNSRIQAVRIG